jgi:hypothetical protein
MSSLPFSNAATRTRLSSTFITEEEPVSSDGCAKHVIEILHYRGTWLWLTEGAIRSEKQRNLQNTIRNPTLLPHQPTFLHSNATQRDTFYPRRSQKTSGMY